MCTWYRYLYWGTPIGECIQQDRVPTRGHPIRPRVRARVCGRIGGTPFCCMYRYTPRQYPLPWVCTNVHYHGGTGDPPYIYTGGGYHIGI